MATVEINGNLIDFPDDLPPEELQKAVASAAQQMGGGQPQRSLGGKAWDALALPEQKSRQLLTAITERSPKFSGRAAGQMVVNLIPGVGSALAPFAGEVGARLSPDSAEPSGKLVRDLVTGAPRVGMEILSEYAPSNISRGALLTAGGAKLAGLAAPVAKTLLRGLGRQGESMSGSVPGALEAAYKDSSLMGAKGKKAVSEMYETAKATTGGMRKSLKMISDKRAAVDESLKLAEEGTLNPFEALEARKELVKIKKHVPNAYFQHAKDKFNSVAKQVFGAADETYQRANMAESLRNIVPQNKYGGASAFKMALMSLAGNDGAFGKLVSFGLSPFVQGAAATGTGVAARQILGPLTKTPSMAAALAAALKSRKEKSNGR